MNTLVEDDRMERGRIVVVVDDDDVDFDDDEVYEEARVAIQSVDGTNNDTITSETNKTLTFEFIQQIVVPNMARTAREMREMMAASEQATRLLDESMKHVERTIERVREPTLEVIDQVRRLQNVAVNTEMAMPYMEELCEVMRLVDADRLKIKQGPKTTIGEYIDKLFKIKKFERFAWVNSIQYRPKDLFRSEKTIKTIYHDYLLLMAKGEKILVQEFIGKQSNRGNIF